MPDSAAALAVLVLAWDEAAPAVLTVVEAAPSIGSLLVLLPPVAPPAATPAAPATALLSAPATAPQAPSLLPQPGLAGSTAGAPASQLAAQQTPASTPTAPAQQFIEQEADNQLILGNTPVRLLHLTPGLAWPVRERGASFRVPAAPYLGATPASQYSTYIPEIQLFINSAPLSASSPLRPLAASQRPVGEPSNALANRPATTATVAAPAKAPVAPSSPAVAPLPLAEAAFAASEILDPNPEEELYPAASAQAPAPTPADSPALADPAPNATFPGLGPFGNRLPQLDTSPLPARPPAPRADAEPEELLEEPATSFVAAAAGARHYPAPDLNSQVITYARLAVPTALAEAFEVIYAPAWPTWLAALELRQRTSRPLALHLVALAAGRQPADTAAGWPADIQRQVLRQADLVLVETYTLARRLRRELGLASSAVRVVPAHDAAAIARALRRARRRP